MQADDEEDLSSDTICLEKAGFFFLGPISKSGLPVLYIIMNRFLSFFILLFIIYYDLLLINI